LSNLRLIFFGTADLACSSLQALASSPTTTVQVVVTQPDRAKGRDLHLQPTPVKALATRLGLCVWQPERARDDAFIAQVKAAQPELLVVAAYGQILPQALLDIPKWGCLNIHASLLPRHRGAAPIQWALAHGDAQTGVTIMKMDAGLDTGDILTQETTPIMPADTGQTLHDRLARMGADLLVRTIPGYVAGNTRPQPQPNDGATYARKVRKEDGRIRWEASATTVWNHARAFVPWPGAYTFIPARPAPILLKAWGVETAASQGVHPAPGTVLGAGRDGLVVACGEGAVRITELQREGGRRLGAAAFLLGHPLPVGLKLG
jgi:methionyl-tRNA formyltransferase